MNGALLYYHHLCQKGRDKIVEGDLYLGTSKSAEGYDARITFQRAKEEGIDIGRTLTPPPRLKSCCVVVMLVEHRKILENVRKIKLKHVDKYKDDFPVICKGELYVCGVSQQWMWLS